MNNEKNEDEKGTPIVQQVLYVVGLVIFGTVCNWIADQIPPKKKRKKK